MIAGCDVLESSQNCPQSNKFLYDSYARIILFPSRFTGAEMRRWSISLWVHIHHQFNPFLKASTIFLFAHYSLIRFIIHKNKLYSQNRTSYYYNFSPPEPSWTINMSRVQKKCSFPFNSQRHASCAESTIRVAYAKANIYGTRITDT